MMFYILTTVCHSIYQYLSVVHYLLFWFYSSRKPFERKVKVETKWEHKVHVVEVVEK